MEISEAYRFCPHCGAKRQVFNPARPYRCEACGFTSFFSPVTAVGAVTATYKSISPATTATMGIALGIWNGSSCGVVIANDNAIVNTTVIGNASAAGTLRDTPPKWRRRCTRV